MNQRPGASRPTREEIAGLEKAEIHVHLEGTADAGVLRDLLAARNAPPLNDPQALFRHRDFSDFLLHFRDRLDLLSDPSDYGFLADRYLATAPSHGIRHIEFYLSLGSAMRRGHAARDVLESIRRAADRHAPGVTVSILIDAVRQFGPDAAAAALEEGLRHRDLGLVSGFGMGGDEMSLPCSAFTRVFALARDNGLRTTVHAGEAGGPESVREALDELRPDRIAHGIAAAEDPFLMDRLARHRIPLDVCPTSNQATGVVQNLEDHPVKRLIEAGVPVTIGSDDPGLFGTNLTNEYLLTSRIASLDTDALASLARTSLEARFPLPV